MSSYWQKLKHPSWQKKRLAILERDEFSCQNCGDTETELQVHHLYYKPRHDPWQYPDSALVCVCKDCHESLQNKKNFVDSLVYPWPSLEVEFIDHKLIDVLGRHLKMLFAIVYFEDDCFVDDILERLYALDLNDASLVSVGVLNTIFPRKTYRQWFDLLSGYVDFSGGKFLSYSLLVWIFSLHHNHDSHVNKWHGLQELTF